MKITSSEKVLNLDTPISALTNGASILIDVTTLIDGGDVTSGHELGKLADAMFSKAEIFAKLINDNDTVTLKYSGHTLARSGQIFLSLDSKGKLSEMGKWNRVKVTSSPSLHRVKIYWRNFRL